MGLGGSDAVGQSLHHATQARVRGEHPDQRLGRDEPARDVGYPIDGKKQQGAALHELTALRPPDRGKAVVAYLKFRRQPVGRHLHEFRRGGLHHR